MNGAPRRWRASRQTAHSHVPPVRRVPDSGDLGRLRAIAGQLTCLEPAGPKRTKSLPESSTAPAGYGIFRARLLVWASLTVCFKPPPCSRPYPEFVICFRRRSCLGNIACSARAHLLGEGAKMGENGEPARKAKKKREKGKRNIVFILAVIDSHSANRGHLTLVSCILILMSVSSHTHSRPVAIHWMAGVWALHRTMLHCQWLVSFLSLCRFLPLTSDHDRGGDHLPCPVTGLIGPLRCPVWKAVLPQLFAALQSSIAATRWGSSSGQQMAACMKRWRSKASISPTSSYLARAALPLFPNL